MYTSGRPRDQRQRKRDLAELQHRPGHRPGDYFWTAYYSGDGNNNAAATGCNDASEKLTIIKASPTVTTQAGPDVAVGIDNTFAGNLS